LGPVATWQWQTKSEEEDVVFVGGAAPRHGRGLVLPDVCRAFDALRHIVVTKLRENQTHRHHHLSFCFFASSLRFFNASFLLLNN
jgi:hypothetical protein